MADDVVENPDAADADDDDAYRGNNSKSVVSIGKRTTRDREN